MLRDCRWDGLAGILVILGGSLAGAAEPAAGTAEFFETRIRPVLVEHCHACHGPASKPARGGLRVDRRGDLLQGGGLGPALVPGKPDDSRLYTAVTHQDPDLQMPKGKPKLPDKILADLRDWIAAGAVWPETGPAPATSHGFDLAGRKADLPWLWQPPRPQPAPAVQRADWPRGKIDQFLLSRLEEAGLAPAEEARPEIWLRRVHFTLTGLPPTPEQLAAFVRDPSDGAREGVVDGLLASPEFGVRWARHWLDLMRYAESRGHESDFIIPNATEYRDYVVRALNNDLPYDAFVREHLAGDLVPQPRLNPQTGANESLLATGWAFLGEEIHAPVDTRLDETERIDNRIDVLSKSFLGLTVACARCHDHKFDAISQRDYYALAGFFLSTGQRLARFETIEAERRATADLDRLTSQHEPAVRAAFRHALQDQLPETLTYLRTAMEGLRTFGLPNPEPGKQHRPQDFAPDARQALEKLAQQNGLDAERLMHWVAALLTAIPDRDDLWHAAAQSALGRAVPREAQAEPLGVDLWSTLGLAPTARVLVDAGTLRPGSADWSADGFAFGTHSLPAGGVQLDSRAKAAQPLFRLNTLASAATQLDWRALDLAPGTEREPTQYGGWKRDGAMWRTPKFELKTGRVHYLVRGAGRIFAAVDSQRLVTGPIHTGQLREWGFNDRWHWVSHDLTLYAGHRMSIEFSPHDDFDTAVAMVVESDAPPAAPVSVGRHQAQTLGGEQPATADALLAHYRQLFAGAIASLAEDRTSVAAQPNLQTAPRQYLHREVARALLRHPQWFRGADGGWPVAIAEPLQAWQSQRLAVLNQISWKSRTAPAMLDGNGVDEFLLVRGKHQKTDGLIARRSLEALAGQEPLATAGGSGRWELAQQWTRSDNPLVARVLVNRVWQHVFGRGIVSTVDNFGVLGTRPTHPELLDDLAATFVDQDRWSLKALIRRLVLTRAFAMSSDPDQPAAEQVDSENLLLHRMNLRRLEGEAIRDAILAVSGRLDTRQGGGSVPLHESQFIEARGLRPERGPLDGEGRRSLYVAARRNFPPLMMTAFDTPTPFTTVGRRNISNVPGQMLFLMNDPFVHQQAGLWAQKVLAAPVAGADPAEQQAERIRGMFRAAYSREPTADELARCQTLLAEAAAVLGPGTAEVESWTELCHALWAVKEFLFVR